MTKVQTLIITAMAGLMMATSANAAGLKRNDPNRPVAAISADLGVTSDQFVTCFWNVNPAEGGNPTAARERANKAILLPCLQKANASITNDMLDSVMDKHRPEGRISRN